MAYASGSDVAGLVRHVMGGASDFTSTSSPTSTQVAAWLTSGCAIIEAKVGSRGYGAIPVTSPVYGVAKDINAFYAAWQAELSLISARVDRTENTRDQRFFRAFERLLEFLSKMNLSVLGVSRTRGFSPPYAGGISQDDKDANNNGDTVQSRFQRGQFVNPERMEPVTNTSVSAS